MLNGRQHESISRTYLAVLANTAVTGRDVTAVLALMLAQFM